MEHKTLSLIVFGMFAIITACAPGQIETLIEEGSTSAAEVLPAEQFELLQEGIGPLEITPPAEGESHDLHSANDLVEGNISSRGEQTFAESSSGEPGTINSQDPGGLAVRQEINPELIWLTHQEADYHYSLVYPDVYTILPQDDSQAADHPKLLHQLRILDRQLASGDTAEFEIPAFTIEVFELEDLSLEDFLNQFFEDGNRDPIKFKGMKGVRVYYDQLIAPNEFYYFAERGYVYKLTPLGLYGQEMLESFQIK
jgi:hypothetical protein